VCVAISGNDLNFCVQICIYVVILFLEICIHVLQYHFQQFLFVLIIFLICWQLRTEYLLLSSHCNKLSLLF
jgi:hypothetical protein